MVDAQPVAPSALPSMGMLNNPYAMKMGAFNPMMNQNIANMGAELHEQFAIEAATDRMRDSLNADALRLFEGRDQIKVISDDKKGRKVHFGEKKGMATFIHTLPIEGVMVDDFKPFFADHITEIRKIAPKIMSYDELETLNGHTIAHHQAETGVPLVQPRSAILVYYHHHDGEAYSFINSTNGCEALNEKYKHLLGKRNIYGSIPIDWYNFKPLKNDQGEVIGTLATHVVQCHPRGHLPDVVVKLIASTLKGTMEYIATAVQKK